MSIGKVIVSISWATNESLNEHDKETTRENREVQIVRAMMSV